MSISLEKPRLIQAFNSVEATAENPQPLVFDNFILPWAKKLPDGRIVDLAAGDCVEAKLLAKAGFRCLAIDASPLRLQEGGYPDAQVGPVDKLNLPNNSVSGLLLKDTLVFLPPDTRKSMFNEAKRVLKPGGSMLVISQLSEALRIHYVPNGSNYPIKDTYPDNENWEAHLKSLRGDQIIAVEFATTPETTAREAEQAGMKGDNLLIYDFNHPIALENRWVQRSGFITEIKIPEN
jgi:hypothetical protein